MEISHFPPPPPQQDCPRSEILIDFSLFPLKGYTIYMEKESLSRLDLLDNQNNG
jgi:hypothetical protein